MTFPQPVGRDDLVLVDLVIARLNLDGYSLALILRT
jgi:hypothetical protein